jgi:hypothetical protein
LSAAELAVSLAGKGTVEVKEKDADFPSRGAVHKTAAPQDFAVDPKVDIDEGFEIYYRWLNTSDYWRKNL